MKYLLTILLTLFISVGYSQDVNNYDLRPVTERQKTKEKPTKNQVYFIERADKLDTVQATVVYVGGEEEPSVVMYGDQVRVMFTLEQVQKMNNKYRMVELLEEVIKKYGIESDIDVGIVNSLNTEIFLLTEKVEILNGRIEDKDLTIAKLELTVASLEKKGAVSDAASATADDIIKEKDKEISKLKRHKVMIAIGAGILVVLIALVAI